MTWKTLTLDHLGTFRSPEKRPHTSVLPKRSTSDLPHAALLIDALAPEAEPLVQGFDLAEIFSEA